MIGQSGPTARAASTASSSTATRSTRSGRERAALVEPGEQQEIVDEHLHPGGLDPDAAHDPGEVGGTFVRAALEQLRVRGDRAQRGAQLVRRVRDELAELLLGLGPAREGLLDVAEHHVERRAEPPDLGAVVLGDAAG